jgi:hypothetical protein
MLAINNDQNIRCPEEPESSRLNVIRDLVQRFTVCWEAHPKQAVVAVLDPKQNERRFRRTIREIGFSLELYGTPEPWAKHVSPGCARCRRVQSALKEIAEWILPREQRKCTFQIETEPPSLHYSPVRKNRPDLCVTIQILHRNNWDQPIDDCEDSCLNEMERVLHELGACKGAWRPLLCKPVDVGSRLEPTGACPKEGSA